MPYNLGLFLALFASWFVARRWDFLSVERVTTPIFSVGVANPVRIEVENQSDMTIRLKVRDAPPADSYATGHEFEMELAPGGLKQLDYTVTPRNRGHDQFRGTYVRWLAPQSEAR